jgi:hypothetical protein
MSHHKSGNALALSDLAIPAVSIKRFKYYFGDIAASPTRTPETGPLYRSAAQLKPSGGLALVEVMSYKFVLGE